MKEEKKTCFFSKINGIKFTSEDLLILDPIMYETKIHAPIPIPERTLHISDILLYAFEYKYIIPK